MTIQPSVVIWTILCFAGLYLILRFLLFQPMLRLMDERQEKITAARTQAETARTQAEEERQLRRSEREQAARQRRDELEQTAKLLRLEEKEKLESAKAERFAQIEAYRADTEKAYEDDLNKAAPAVDRAAEHFLSRLFKD